MNPATLTEKLAFAAHCAAGIGALAASHEGRGLARDLIEDLAAWRLRELAPLTAADREELATARQAAADARAAFIARKGRERWTMLHTRARTAAEDDGKWIDRWLAGLPCGECRKTAQPLLAEIPPRFGADYFAWSVEFHNAVNAGLHKPIVSLAEAEKLWP